MLWENIGIGVALISWYTYRFISVKDYVNAGNIIMLVSYILNLIGSIIHYRIAKTNKIAAFVYCDVQTVLIFVLTVEGTILVTKILDSMAFSAITALLSSYSFISYNQTSLFLIYVGLSIYGCLRNYFHFKLYYTNGGLDSIRFTIFFCVAFIFIYCFSRAFSKRERNRFVQAKHQRQLL